MADDLPNRNGFERLRRPADPGEEQEVVDQSLHPCRGTHDGIEVLLPFLLHDVVVVELEDPAETLDTDQRFLQIVRYNVRKSSSSLLRRSISRDF